MRLQGPSGGPTTLRLQTSTIPCSATAPGTRMPSNNQVKHPSDMAAFETLRPLQPRRENIEKGIIELANNATVKS
jgi:hypothetical protein